MFARVALVCFAITACGCSASKSTTVPAPDPSAAADDKVAAADKAQRAQAEPALPTGPPLSEVDARDRVTRAFRAAGLRILHDQLLEAEDASLAVTLDGFDPERKIGFEYIAQDEVGTDVAPAEITALRKPGAHRVLVIEAADAAAVDARVAEFLAALPAPSK